jgi:hypothetical protein
MRSPFGDCDVARAATGVFSPAAAWKYLSFFVFDFATKPQNQTHVNDYAQ